MAVPRKPRRSRGGFQPPHCPNPNCHFHLPRPDWHFVKCGHGIRKSDRRRIQVFRCRHCGRYFSPPTFSTTYWLKRRDLLKLIADKISEGPGLRQIARTLGTSHATVARHVARLGRHCLLYHANRCKDFRLQEPLVIDGFETYEASKFYPFHINFAVGSQSWFIYNFTDAPLRRKGRMTAGQKRKRAKLEDRFGRPDPKAVELSMAELVRPLLKAVPHGRLVIHSDDHQAYPRALRRLGRQEPGCPVMDLRVTSSKKPRTRSNPLFPVNLTDLLTRHGCANHRRKTIAFSKRRQAGMERAAVFTVWRNYCKRRSENGPARTVGMAAAMAERMLTFREVLCRRLFPGHVELTESWRKYYWRRVKTAVMGDRQTTHCLRYAF